MRPLVALLLLATLSPAASRRYPQITLLLKKRRLPDADKFAAAAARAMALKDPKAIAEIRSQFAKKKRERKVVLDGRTIEIKYASGTPLPDNRRLWWADGQPAKVRKVILRHKGYITLKSRKGDAVLKDYRILCRLAAELYGDDVLAIWFPEAARWLIAKEDLPDALRKSKPLAALDLASALIPPAPNSKGAKQEIEEADRHASVEFKRFRRAWKTYKKKSKLYSEFRVAIPKQDDDLTEVTWFAVFDVKKTRVYGLPVGSYWATLEDPDPQLFTSFSVYDIADWTFRKKGTLQGGFRRKAEAQAEAGDK